MEQDDADLELFDGQIAKAARRFPIGTADWNFLYSAGPPLY